MLGRGSTTVYSDAAATLIAALPRAGVERLVLCTSAGVEARDTGEVLPYRMLDQVAEPTWRHATPTSAT